MSENLYRHDFTCEGCGLRQIQTIELGGAVARQIRDSVEDEVRAEERARLASDQDLALRDLKRQLNEALAGRQEAEKAELELRSRERAIEERERNVALEVARHRQEVKAEAAAELQVEHEAEKRELLQQNERLRADLDMAARRAQPGSPLERGFIHQDLIAEGLHHRFPTDTIDVTPRGRTGADVRQYVRGRIGGSGLLLLIEVKAAQTWDPDWVVKLHKDHRDAQAKVSLLVTFAQPPHGPGVHPLSDSLWVAHAPMAEVAVGMLREQILALAHQEAIHAQDANAHYRVFSFLTSAGGGVDCLNRMLEGVANQQKALRDEQAAMAKAWKLRQDGLAACLESIGRFVGGLESAGAVLPEQLRLQLPGSESRAIQASVTPALLNPAAGTVERTCRSCGRTFETPSRPGRPPVVCDACRTA